MKNKFLVVASAALVAMMSFVPAFAQTGEIVVTAGSKTVVGANITFPGVVLDGTDNLNEIGTTTVYTATDYSGAAAGWALQIEASALENGDGGTIPMTGFEMTVPSLTLVNDGTPAAQLENLFVTANDLTVAAQNVVVAAAGEGMGKYTFTPTFTLDVPATTHAGTYQSTIILTMAATP